MEILITKDRQQKKRLTPRMIRLVSDIAVVAEIQRQMGLSSCNEYSYSAWSDEENDIWKKDNLEPLLTIEEFMNQGTGLASLVKDLRVFDYPSDKPRSAASTAKMRSAEQALDTFWEQVNEQFVRRTGKSLQTLEANTIHYRDIQRTPAWISAEEGRSKVDTTQVSDWTHMLATLVERTERTIEQPQTLVARRKTKTRGSPCGHSQEQLLGLRSEADFHDTVSAAPRLTVKKKAFKAFAAIFGKPIADKLPGELPWIDFKRAMVNVGSTAEKHQGSAWLFRSDNASIIFHEPHPESKLPMQCARRIARRLNRNFGWTIDTFVLDDEMGEVHTG
ncbi:MAG: hypothetical protein Q9209_007553 [Squamulea sp. 1 TL-2023]